MYIAHTQVRLRPPVPPHGPIWDLQSYTGVEIWSSFPHWNIPIIDRP